MSTALPASSGSRRRLVLVDLDWSEADLVPELLRHPGLYVTWVGGSHADDPGMRVAELCGVPRSLDLTDLTRDGCDVALIGERSPRRAQLIGLMQAHGASVGAPRAYLESIRSEERRTSATHPEPVSGAPHGAAPAEDEWTWLVGTKATPSAAEPEPAPDDSHTIPARDDTTGVERHLAWLAAGTGALGAAVFERRDGRAEPFAAHGSEDRWLYALADLALRADTPQVVVRLRGGAPGVWGAWPFRVHERRLVIAAGGMRDAAPADAWERAAFELESTWNLSPSDRDPERTFREAWLTPAEFRGRLRRAVERHQQEETNFAVHRIHVESGPVELLCQRLPAAIRATDSLCRVEPGVVLLLLTGSAAAARPVRERILRLWTECHDGGAVAGIADERIALTRPEDAEAFLANATRWLASL